MTDSLQDRMPPASIEAEQSLIGSLMIDKHAYYSVCDKVKPSDCYRETHSLVLSAIYALYRANEPVDIVAVQEKLRNAGKLDAAGGTDYLCALIDSVPSAANALFYAETVAEKSTRRKLISLAERLQVSARDTTKHLKDVLGTAQQGMIQIVQGGIKGEWVSYGDIMAQVLEQVEEAYERGTPNFGLPTGIHGLDKILCGLNAPDIIMLAALSSRGKSLLMQQIAESVADEGNPVAMFSLEMSKLQLGYRSLQSRSGLPGVALRNPKFGTEGWERVTAAAGELANAPIYVNDASGLHYMDIQAQARRMVMEKGVKLIVLDYLQLIRSDKGESRSREVGVVMEAVKSTAKDLNIPFILLSQLNRNPEKDNNRKPRLSDLRDSGEIEQNADVVIFIHHDKDGSELIVAKNRQFACGSVPITWLKEKMRFADQSERSDDVDRRDSHSDGRTWRAPYADD